MSNFTTVSRAKATYEAPSQDGLGSARFLNIGSDYGLLIATEHQLIIQPGRVGNTWTPASKDYQGRY